jgi:putative transposase
MMLIASYPAIVFRAPSMDRNGRFEPEMLRKHQTRFDRFDDKILSMYARGMTTRDIQAHLQEMYGVEVGAGLVSEVTDAVLEEVEGVAGPAAGAGIPDRLPGCVVREDATRGPAGEPCGVRRDRGCTSK